MAGHQRLAWRIGVVERGSRQRGVWLALLWNVTGFALATTLPGAGVTNSGELLMTACGFTLWSFLGLLTLPSFSPPAINCRMKHDGAHQNGWR